MLTDNVVCRLVLFSGWNGNWKLKVTHCLTGRGNEASSLFQFLNSATSHHVFNFMFFSGKVIFNECCLITTWTPALKEAVLTWRLHCGMSIILLLITTPSLASTTSYLCCRLAILHHRLFNCQNCNITMGGRLYEHYTDTLHWDQNLIGLIIGSWSLTKDSLDHLSFFLQSILDSLTKARNCHWPLWPLCSAQRWLPTFIVYGEGWDQKNRW